MTDYQRLTATLNKLNFGRCFYTVVHFPQIVLDGLPLEADIDGFLFEMSLKADLKHFAEVLSQRAKYFPTNRSGNGKAFFTTMEPTAA